MRVCVCEEGSGRRRLEETIKRSRQWQQLEGVKQYRSRIRGEGVKGCVCAKFQVNRVKTGELGRNN